MTNEPVPVGDLANAKLENLKNNSSSDNTPTGENKQHGGAREGAGRPKGTENQDTKIRRAAEATFKDRVARNVDRLFNSQLDAALGEKFLFVKRTIGEGAKKRTETEIVKDPEIIKAYLDGEYDSNQGDDDYYFISTKAANNMAIDSLLNRAFGTPQKNVDLTSKGQSIMSSTDDTELKRIAAAASEAVNDTDS